MSSNGARDHWSGAVTNTLLAHQERPTIHTSAIVPVRHLVEGQWARSGELDAEHVRSLATLPGAFAPVLVQRETMQVIDGAHRVAAARQRGDTHIAVWFFEGSDAECFLESVRANVRHGKPLTLTERRRAALRLLSHYSHWSDRSLAETCGLSPGTIASLRRCATDDFGHSRRIGRDGRIRSLNTSSVRMAAADYLVEHPQSSVREVAQAVGATVATVRDVRARLARGEPAVPASPCQPRAAALDGGLPDRGSPSLRSDPAFRRSVSSQAFASWFDRSEVSTDSWQQLTDDLPLSRLYDVITQCRRRAAVWEALAEHLECRVHMGNHSG
jgi:hypothetical protein